jgi:hypothetical protein
MLSSRAVSMALLSALYLFAGITPRSSVEDYPFQGESDSMQFGLAYMDPQRAKKLFPMIKKDYIAIEVGVFPKPGESPEIRPDDFAFQIIGNPNSLVRRVEPWGVVAGSSEQQAQRSRPKIKNPLPGDIDIVGSVGVGTGGGIGGPGNCVGCPMGRTTGGGIGVGVGTGGIGGRERGRSGDWPRDSQKDRSPEGDPDTQIRMMEVRELPEGRATKPVSGYLFFPMPEGKTKTGYELIYFGGPKKVAMPMAYGKERKSEDSEQKSTEEKRKLTAIDR